MGSMLDMTHQRVLVVDDNPAIHEDFLKILSPGVMDADLEAAEAAFLGRAPLPAPDSGFQVDTASQGEEAFEKVRQALTEGRPYAVAFVDVRMPPGWDGVETSRRLWEVCPELQVVLCTAFADYSWKGIIGKLGQSEDLLILKKPFDTVEVLQLAHALTRKWNLTRQVRMHCEELDRRVQERTLDLRVEMAERAKAEERFHRAFESSPVPLSILALDNGRHVDVNQSYLDLIGLGRDEVLHQTPVELNLCDDLDKLWRVFHDIAVGKPVRNIELCLHSRGAKDKEILLGGERILLHQTPHALISWQDVTELRQLERELRHAQKMEAIGHLAAGVAHDFNNILTVIQGQASLCLSMETLPAEIRESIDQVAQAANRATGLTRQLLAFSRKQVTQPKILHLPEMLDQSQRLLRRLIGEHIELVVQTSPDLPPLVADPVSLEQVLLNLGTNARDAMPRGGRLTILATEEEFSPERAALHPEAKPGTYVCLSVKDTGCGIPPEIRDRIFEPFFTTKGAGKGTGLGLATVYAIVKQHGGWIEVSSVLDEGTTFSIHLPASSGGAEPALIEVPTTAGQGETILIVEDEPSVRDLTSRILQNHGYRVFTAGSGPEAIQLPAETMKQVDLLLTDMVMPGGMSGRELADSLASTHPQQVVLYCSGYAPEFTGMNLAESEGLHFLSKPFSPRQLLHAVRTCLDEKDCAA